MDIVGMFDIPVWALLLVSTLMLLYIYGTWTHSTWSALGISGPKPLPLLGNSLEQLGKGPQVFSQWNKQYGRVYGIYQGVRPMLVVSDLDLIREVTVKNFSNFADRYLIEGMRPPVVDKGVFFARGATWKRIRNMMTPTFSTSKLKLMCHYINRCSKLLVDSIAQKTKGGELLGVKDVFGSFTMDVIAGTAFGLETNSQTQEAEPFVSHSKKLFGNVFGRSARLVLTLCASFPFLGPLFGRTGLVFFGDENTKFLLRAMDDVFESRKKDPRRDKRTADLLQMLVDAEADADVITDRAEDSDDKKNHRRMTKEEILAQGFLVFIAGFETTATTLQYLAYNLTMHPDAQEKVYQEIVEVIGDEEPTYENVANLPYLDAAIHETLRLFPPVTFVNRQAAETISIRGITVPAGCGVSFPISQILQDDEYFPEPDKFQPERFVGENRSNCPPILVELAFGYGPRQCIGMRLALLEIKFAAVRIYRHFRFVRCDETPEKITLKTPGLSVPDKLIKVGVEQRVY